ncbi:MAG: MFS transporter, partial [Chloroflexi bacterium]|nr:MFS transporter [Chloroflexota bacterium]
IPQYRLLFIRAFFSHAGIQMTSMARPWLAFNVSGSALALGWVAAAQGISMLVFSPLGGVAADRLPKRLVLHVSTAVLMLIAAITAAIVFFDVVQIWHLAVLAILHGIALPPNQPARHSFVPFLVPRAKLPNALGLFSSVRNVNQVVGPSIAGILIVIDPFLAFAVIVVMHAVAFALAAALPPAAPVDRPHRSIVSDLGLGLTYVWTSPTLRTLIGLSLVAIILGFPYQHLLPVFQKEVLDVGPERLGFMYASLGLGALAASMLVATFSDMVHKGYPQLLTGIAFGVALVAFALSPVYLLSLALLFLTGMVSQAYATLNSTLMMLNAEPQFFGRVS